MPLNSRLCHWKAPGFGPVWMWPCFLHSGPSFEMLGICWGSVIQPIQGIINILTVMHWLYNKMHKQHPITQTRQRYSQNKRNMFIFFLKYWFMEFEMKPCYRRCGCENITGLRCNVIHLHDLQMPVFAYRALRGALRSIFCCVFICSLPFSWKY